MTMQIPEYLEYQGRTCAIQQEPLEPYLDSLSPRPYVPWMSTDNYRGYVGRWSVTRGGLYFCSFLHDEDVCPGEQSLKFNDVFPGEAEPVLARWYDGPITFNEGEELGCIGCYHYVHETKVTLEFEAGRLRSEHRRYLTADEFANALKSYEILTSELGLNPVLHEKLGVRDGTLLDLSYRTAEQLFREFQLTAREVDTVAAVLKEHGLRLDMAV